MDLNRINTVFECHNKTAKTVTPTLIRMRTPIQHTSICAVYANHAGKI